MFVTGHIWELVIILVIALLIFGPGKLPKVGRGFGEMIRGFRQEAEAAKAEDAKTEEAKAEKVAPKA